MEIVLRVEFGDAAEKLMLALARTLLHHGWPIFAVPADAAQAGLQPFPDGTDPPAWKEENDVRASEHDQTGAPMGDLQPPYVPGSLRLDPAAFLKGEQNSPAGLSRPADGGGGQ